MKLLIAVAMGCGSLAVIAGTQSNGDYTVNAFGTELGNLTVQSDVHLGGALDLGTTSISQSAMLLSYSENGTVYTFDISATRPSAIFLWQDNAVGALKSKMKLDGSNTLTLYKSDGSSGIVMNPNSSNDVVGISVNGQALLTQALAQTLFVMSGNGTLASGLNATALGSHTTASGVCSTAFGSYTYAFGSYSTVFGGGYNLASGNYATVFGGGYNVASGNYATVFGVANRATGHYSTAFGYGTNTASGQASLAFGEASTASRLGSTAFGYLTSASGDYSTAFGSEAVASGMLSTALGLKTKAKTYASLALGRNNVGFIDVDAGGDSTWNVQDPVLEIGNGGDWGTPSNAVTIFKSGELRTSSKAQFKGGVRVPPQGDLSMGDFAAGQNPADLDPTLGLKYQGE